MPDTRKARRAGSSVWDYAASSPSGAAASNPMIPKTAYRTPGTQRAETDSCCARCGENTANVLCPPAVMISVYRERQEHGDLDHTEHDARPRSTSRMPR